MLDRLDVRAERRWDRPFPRTGCSLYCAGNSMQKYHVRQPDIGTCWRQRVGGPGRKALEGGQVWIAVATVSHANCHRHIAHTGHRPQRRSGGHRRHRAPEP
jgi:hypothetical protein